MATAPLLLEERYNVQVSNVFDLLKEDKPKEKKTRPNRRARQKAAAEKGQAAASGAAGTTASSNAPSTSDAAAPKAPAANKAPAAKKQGPAPTSAPAIKTQETAVDRRKTDRGPKKEKPKPNTREIKKATRDQRRERHPGTGRSLKDHNKRGGGGARNWGKPGDELEADVDRPEPEEEEEKEPEKSGDSPKEEGKEGAKEGEEAKETKEEGKDDKSKEEEDEKLITFEDYQKTLSEKKAKVALPPPRKAGEGVEENPEWAKAVVHKKDDFGDGLFTAEPVKATKKATNPNKKKDKKSEKVPITDVLKVQPSRSEGGRGRGRGRGRRDFDDSRGGRWPRGRGERSPKKFHGRDRRQPNFDDRSFPALSPGSPAEVKQN